AKLWARRKVDDVEAQRWSNELDDEEAATAIAKVGLDFGLVTSETSLIAEDETPSRPEGARLTREELPLLLPHGWDFDTLFGLNGAAADDGTDSLEADQAEALELPQTATLFAGKLQEGLVMLLIGLGGLAVLIRRRRKEA
ncbi:MAG: marine proteobacterial sortase target protein, partial [Novosphingobium sp.]|nr:marine proteobacterial sortase target protein [Novosphingobium sp.]